MGKEKKRMLEGLREMQDTERALRRKKKELIINCDHKNDKGKWKLQLDDETGQFRCKYCGVKFFMTTYNNKTVEDAVGVVHDMLQQIRCFANDDDVKWVRILGELDMNLQDAAELYQRTIDTYVKKKDKTKKKQRDEFGSYGTESLSFMGGGGGGKGKKKSKKKFY